MNPKNTWMLVVLAAGLFAFIYFFERRLQPPVPVVERVLPGLSPDDVTSIQIEPLGQFLIQVDRTNGVWMLTKPHVYPVRAAVVESLLKALENLSPQGHISAQELSGVKNVGSTYGFDAPRTTIVLQQGDDQRKLALGNSTPPGDGIYAQVVGNPDVEIIGNALAALIPTSDGQWRDTSFVNLQGLPFDGLTVAGANGTLIFHRSDPDQPWGMVKPDTSRANNGRIKELLDRLQTLNVAVFATDDSNADLEAYGLQTPQLALTFQQNTNVLLSVQFGKSPTNEPELVYARTNSSSSIVLVPNEDLNYWSQESWRFRDPYLFTPTGSNRPGSFECDGADGHADFIVHLTNGIVAVTDRQGLTYPVDAGELIAFYKNLVNMQVVQWAPGQFAREAVADSDLPAMGLAPIPQRRYLLKKEVDAGTPAPILAQMDFGFPNTNNPGTVCARRSDLQELSVYAVNSNDLDRLPTNGLQLRLRQVWSFEATNVTRLRIEAAGHVNEWQHGKPNLWQPLPQGIADDQMGMFTEDFVARLGVLEAESWVAHGDPTAAQGFTEQSLKITVTINDRPQTVTFGGHAPNGSYYACTRMEDGQNWIFIISAKDVTDLSKDLQTILH